MIQSKEKEFYFKLYAADFLLDEKVDVLPDPAQLLLVKMWCLCCLHGYAPSDPTLLAKRAKMDANVVHLHLQSVMQFFYKVDTDKLVSPRLEAEMAKSGRVSDVRRKAAKSMWEKRKARKGDMDIDANASARAEANGQTNPMQLESQSELDNTPLTPQGESAGDTPEKTKVSRRSKRRSRQEILTDLELEGISQEAIAAGQEIRGFWTKTDKDGRKIETSLDMLIPRLDDIHKRQPLFTFPVLILAGKLYIDTPKKATKAAQHFFSLEPEKATGKPPFYDWARAAKHKIDAGVVSEPRAPDPAPPEPTPLIPLAEGFTMPDGVAE